MIVYFNNCHGRDHVGLFGSGAFYDLNTVGVHAKKAKNLRVGQQCIVASPGNDNKTHFSWFSFLHEDTRVDDTGVPCRVFFGEFIKSESLSKVDAAKSDRDSAFFDLNGNFKRLSAIEEEHAGLTMNEKE